MDVERANAGDIDALVEMRLAYLLEDNGFLSDGEVAAIRSGLPGYYREHLGKDLVVFIVREGQAIVSCAFLLEIDKPMSPAFLSGRTGTVLNVYTRPSHRRRGYAALLMKALLAEARNRDLSVVELKATEDGYALYQTVGFSDDHSKYHNMKWINQ